jgi:hypothetical protein
VFGIAGLIGAAACEAPDTFVVFDNDYPVAAGNAMVVYRATWQAIALQDSIAPGRSSDPQDTIAASENTAYAILAPGWDPASAARPGRFVVLQSRQGFAVHLNNTLHIPIDDASFAGNCAAGSVLSQAQADFITQLVFPDVFVSLRYDAATCAVTPVGDAGGS